jgi:DNA-directed RNA polymerase subunit RPC12/RpoP
MKDIQEKELTDYIVGEDDEILETIEAQFDESLMIPCASCGGKMKYNPEGANLKCSHCDSTRDIMAENGHIIELCFESALKEDLSTWDEAEVQSFSCKNCGAEVIFEAHTQAKFCNYCGSSYISLHETQKTIPPHYLVPFKVDQQEAEEKFKQWISKRWFAPNDLKKEYNNHQLLGTYIPYWTYDTHTYSYYTADRGDYYYVTRTRVVDGKTQTYQERKIRWTHVRGDYPRFFDDVLIRASNKVDELMLKKIEPFNLTALVAYKPEYLSGFFAERYSISLEDGWTFGIKIIDDSLKSEITGKIGGDQVRFLNVDTAYNSITYKHILLPIWLSSYQYQTKVYHFMVNGQNGIVHGDFPKSPWKIAGAVLLTLTIILIIAYFVMQNGA